mmetsp:Transcript_35414/g.40947  ORF Transcript_35414/g.40947 Transcript_35414/m.40947 type:complete len:87 (+) Transcript_35414:685-945(+)|eukprot:CAMPEP_0168327324 /NCGR_PEP_ID=MMETSP0213-20121227/5832_1 /TAXON_ID=151035 /ORGANISM="Euplotes harpa, Strain FSP1.4" /LENGTH=86 /DNA_ID=CAMNT_0008330211 /DNA_START=685 /DNA_END=945 /DNA_ORIENTATION=+
MAKTDTEIKILDSFLPPIAYIRLVTGEAHGFKPHELYSNFVDAVGNIKMIQSFVYFRGSLQTPLAYSTYICEYEFADSKQTFNIRK